jgi:hypothetical protein
MPSLFNWIANLFKSTKATDGGADEDSIDGWRSTLQGAVHDSVRLMAFASRSGKSMEPQSVKSILEMVRLIDGPAATLAIDADTEQQFWMAYSAMVEVVKPVTSDSIYATLEFHANPSPHQWLKRSLAQKTVFKYGVYSLVVLVSIVYFQSYMQMGVSIRDHLLKSFHAQQQSIDDFFTRKIAAEDARLKAAGLEGQENPINKLYENYKVNLRLAKLRASQDEFTSWVEIGGAVFSHFGVETDPRVLATLKNQTSWLSLTHQQKPASKPNLSLIGPGPSQQAPPDMPADLPPQASPDSLDLIIIDELNTVVIPSYVALNESERTLRLISEFILPLLYGLLGASAFVLRDLTNTISAVTFSRSKMINYNLRLIMGPLVGIAVGLFLAQPASDIFNETGGLASENLAARTDSGSTFGIGGLAFLAGYSVEMLFSALDNLVGAFASQNQKQDKGSNDPATNPPPKGGDRP